MYVRHGLTGTPTYHSWYGAIRRCEDKRDKHYEDYGGRGIKVCPAIRTDLRVLVDAIGLKPPGHYSIDRIDNDGHYSCGSCTWCISNGFVLNLKWATPIEQANNRRIYKTNKSGGSGVNLLPSGRFWARKYIDGKRVTVGTFDTLEEARDAIKGYTNA